MNIFLSSGLPEDYDGIPISPDFRNMIQLEAIQNDDSFTDSEKVWASLSQLYPKIPDDINKALNGITWFYNRGENSKEENNSSNSKRGYDFEQDGSHIFSAFVEVYDIDLEIIDFLHWWKFMALFEGLPEDTLIKRIIYWRTVELSKLTKEEKKHVIKMRELFSLKKKNTEKLTVEEIEKQAKDKVEARFAEAKKKLEGSE